MERPFIYGKAASGYNFTDREIETEKLSNNFRNGINTIIISPRRWGKTSLVKHVAEKVSNERIVVVLLDVFSCKSEDDFYRVLSKAVIQQTSNKWEEWIENAKNFLSKVRPKFSFGSDPINEFSFSMDMSNDMTTDAEYILKLPERIAKDKGINIVICIDEFQQVADFNDSKRFQKVLRSVWQHSDNVSYCLFGSKQHLMNELFEKKSLPFYKFGDVMFLGKIDERHWVDYIVERFQSTGKNISEYLAIKICEFTECHSSYTQQLAWLVWNYTNDDAKMEDLEMAKEDIIGQNSPLFQRDIEPLSGYQLNFLRAMRDGIVNEFSQKGIIDKYELGSSANVVRVKNALIKREIIDIAGKNVYFTDVIFKQWLKRNLD